MLININNYTIVASSQSVPPLLNVLFVLIHLHIGFAEVGHSITASPLVRCFLLQKRSVGPLIGAGSFGTAPLVHGLVDASAIQAVVGGIHTLAHGTHGLLGLTLLVEGVLLVRLMHDCGVLGVGPALRSTLARVLPHARPTALVTECRHLLARPIVLLLHVVRGQDLGLVKVLLLLNIGRVVLGLVWLLRFGA